MATDWRNSFGTAGRNDNRTVPVFSRRHIPPFRWGLRVFEEIFCQKYRIVFAARPGGRWTGEVVYQIFLLGLPVGVSWDQDPVVLREQAEPRQFLQPRQRLAPKSDRA